MDLEGFLRFPETGQVYYLSIQSIGTKVQIKYQNGQKNSPKLHTRVLKPEIFPGGIPPEQNLHVIYVLNVMLLCPFVLHLILCQQKQAYNSLCYSYRYTYIFEPSIFLVNIAT